MKLYCVVYFTDTFHYRFRCSAKTKTEAKRQCVECLGIKYKDIVEVYTED